MMKIDGSNYGWLATQNMAGSTGQGRKPLGIERSSGHICPQTGYWQLDGNAQGTIVSVKRGSLMPYHQGQPGTWRLTEYDPGAEALEE